ncbi:MAG TPA: hypothetical protein PK319_08000 [Chitinophagaceae bacterium]|nr:hypothetical protein [Chitinophagaceae bacterium]
MRFFFLIALISTGLMISSCGGSKTTDLSKPFCDTACFSDSLIFAGEHPLKPYVIISGDNCKADTITWSFKSLKNYRKISIPDVMKRDIALNPDYLRCYIRDTSFAFVIFNDCISGRGYWLKLPFNKTADIGRKSGALNNFDRKFSMPDNIVAYTDRGNLFIEDITNGKTAMMSFGEDTGLDFDAIHETIDSVNITPARIWAKVNLGGKWTDMQKDIQLK